MPSSDSKYADFLKVHLAKSHPVGGRDEGKVTGGYSEKSRSIGIYGHRVATCRDTVKDLDIFEPPPRGPVPHHYPGSVQNGQPGIED